ncbi:zinc finger BED domain-containing protein RICESLEEPER 2-like protein [Tanacetum coccineum]
MSDNTTNTQCIYCFHFFSQNSNSTLKNHISHLHCEALKKVPEAGQSSMSRDGSVFVFNPDVLREQFAGYNHVSRTTLKRDAMKLWVAAKQAIIDGFLNLNTNVNLTTDVWFAPHGLFGSYICVTAHCIEPGTWQIMKRVIAFEDFLVPHTGSALARVLRKTFVNFNLEDKIMSITLDNASNNTSAIGKLKLKYEPPIDGRFYHSRCVAHIINLVVQDGLAVSAINAIKESFKTMLKDVFKSGGRNHQRYIKISSEAGKPCLLPNWDVPTRWNSTYHMFLCGLKQRSTLMYFHDLLASKGRCDHFPNENWVTIESLTQLLEVFHNATKILSRVYYPTSLLVLQQIFFMSNKLTEYELNGGIFLSMVKPMKEKLKKYFQKISPIITCAAALNLCFNVHGVELLIESISTDLKFFDDDHASKAKNGSPTLWKRVSGGNQMTRLLYRLKEHTNKKARSDPSLSFEYERYIHSDFVTQLENNEFATFDLLGFWKAKESIFPVLPRMAIDIISVQATSVASESAFSTSGRVLLIRRTRLTLASLEMCICLKDHLDAQEQHKSSLEYAVDFEEEILDAEVQQNEAIQLSEEEITLDVASGKGTMFGSGSGSGGEEVDYDMTNYGDDY